MTWDEAFSHLDAVRDELQAARFSLAHVEAAIKAGGDPLLMAKYQLKPSHLRRCADNLEMTYILRLFAEFEAILRDYWMVTRPRPTPRRTRMEILIQRVAILRGMPWDILTGADAVRDYRNTIAHHRAVPAVMRFNECKSRLGKYVSYLPTHW